MKPIIIIPALNPDEKIITLVESLNKFNLQIVVVNDGSDQEHMNIFEKLQSE